jgi:hypothetical protein
MLVETQCFASIDHRSSEHRGNPIALWYQNDAGGDDPLRQAAPFAVRKAQIVNVNATRNATIEAHSGTATSAT